MTTAAFGPGRFQSTGRSMLDALHPDPESLNLKDISIALGNICRFGGHIQTFYSVADHSRLVARLLKYRGEPRIVQLAGLVHDVVEIITGDVISPMKPIYGDEESGIVRGLALVEQLWTPVVERWFGLPEGSTGTREVKEADLTAYYLETYELRGWRAVNAPSELPVECWKPPLSPREAGESWLREI